MDQAIGIIGQAVLVVVSLVLLAFLLLLLLAIIRGIKRLLHDLRQPLLPESDFYVPEPFDRGRVSPEEAAYVHEHLDEVQKLRAERGIPLIDPADPKVKERYGL